SRVVDGEKVLASVRPAHPAQGALGYFTPFLSLGIKEGESCGVSRQCRYIAFVGRPPRRIQACGTRQSLDLVGREIKRFYRRGWITSAAAEHDFASIG